MLRNVAKPLSTKGLRVSSRIVLPTRKLSGTMPESTRRDPNTLSNYDCFKTTHTKTDFTIDFDEKTLAGSVKLSLESLKEGQTAIVLDTSYLRIHDVHVDERACQWELLPRSEPFGSPLRISLDSPVDVGKTLTLTVILNLVTRKIKLILRGILPLIIPWSR